MKEHKIEFTSDFAPKKHDILCGRSGYQSIVTKVVQDGTIITLVRLRHNRFLRWLQIGWIKFCDQLSQALKP